MMELAGRLGLGTQAPSGSARWRVSCRSCGSWLDLAPRPGPPAWLVRRLVAFASRHRHRVLAVAP
jgi:hypothetical protein